MGKKALAVIGGVGATLGLAWLISRVKAKPETLQVQVQSNPIKTILLIDDKVEVATPATLTMKPGVHKFSAVPKSPDLMITYGFHYWEANHQPISNKPTVELDLRKPATLTAQYRMVEGGRYPSTLPI